MKKYLLLLILILIFSIIFVIGDAQDPKYWINTYTEVEELGEGKFGATIHVGHQVFFDKTDGQYKKHKLTDERPAKDYVLIQSAKCCVEVYPYYAKYFDVNHEEVRLYEERWAVQRLFKTPNTWRDVDAYNPIITTEETDSGITVNINYTTDYGPLTVKYIQRDGAALKHDILFINTSGSTETFRVLQRWAGIIGNKCNGKDIPVIEDTPYLAFHDSNKSKKNFNIAENLYSMMFNEDGSEKTDQCLQRPIQVETHAQGIKTDFIYGNWVLAQDENLTIDPDTVTLNNPTEDGDITSTATRDNTDIDLKTGRTDAPPLRRAYIEWDISSIPDGATITNVLFKYHGHSHNMDCHIHEMLGARPSTESNSDVYDEIGEGTVYADPAGFPVEGTNQQVDLGASADSDLQGQLTANWFAIGIQNENEVNNFTYSYIYSEEYASTPDPTLYVVYTPPEEEWWAWDVSTAVYSGKYKDINAQESAPAGLFFNSDGTKMYVVGYTNDTVYQYTLSVAWDVSSATYAEKLKDISAQESWPYGLFFKPDGTKMYISRKAYQYSLSAAWDVSTATYDTGKFKDMSAQDSPRGIFLKPDGLKMYMVGDADNVYQYSLSVAWDVSTATYEDKLKYVGDEDTTCYDVFFKYDGTKMYVMGVVNDNIYQYSLSTDWDVSTATYEDKLKYVRGQDDSFRSIFFKPDGLKVYGVGSTTKTVYQYILGIYPAEVNVIFFSTPY